MKKAEFSPSAALRVGLGTKQKKTREKPGLQKLVIFVMFPAVDEA
jgi:hypothetical protein